MKKFLYLLILIYSLIAIPAKATDFQTKLMYYDYGAIALDWAQTRDISTNPRYIEKNKILGPAPTITQVNQYFTTVLIAHYLFQDTKYRDVWNWSVAIAETFAVIHNRRLGVSFKF